MVINGRQLACGVLSAALGLGASNLCGQQPTLPMGVVPSSSSVPQGSVDSQLSSMTQQYGLSQEQQTQLRAILQDGQQMTADTLKDASITPPELFSKLKSIKEDQNKRILAIMTPEQRTKFESDMRKASNPPSGPSAFPPPPPGLELGSSPSS